MATDLENFERAQAVIRGFRFGIEIETVGASRYHSARSYREAVADAIASELGASRTYAGGFYQRERVLLTPTPTPDRFVHWDVMTDGSISSHIHGEVVSPILTFDDIGKLQAVVRAIRRAGARVNRSCGIHVHVGVDGAFRTPAAIARLARFVYSQEELILAATSPNHYRYQGSHGCPINRVPSDFIARLPKKVRSWRTLAIAWYGSNDLFVRTNDECSPGSNDREHYHHTRYRGLNLHAVWNKGTVEFRYFDATLHAGKIRAYLMLCLALCARAVVARSAVARKRPFILHTAAYGWRAVMIKLFLRGDDHKTVRRHLLAPIKAYGFSSSSARTGIKRGGVTLDRFFDAEAASHTWAPHHGS